MSDARPFDEIRGSLSIEPTKVACRECDTVGWMPPCTIWKNHSCMECGANVWRRWGAEDDARVEAEARARKVSIVDNVAWLIMGTLAVWMFVYALSHPTLTTSQVILDQMPLVLLLIVVTVMRTLFLGSK